MNPTATWKMTPKGLERVDGVLLRLGSGPTLDEERNPILRWEVVIPYARWRVKVPGHLQPVEAEGFVLPGSLSAREAQKVVSETIPFAAWVYEPPEGLTFLR